MKHDKNVRHEHMTISIPENLKRDLYLHVKVRSRSRFIADALAEKLKFEKIPLEKQYKLAAKDEASNREFKEWEDAMIDDGLDETNSW